MLCKHLWDEPTLFTSSGAPRSSGAKCERSERVRRCNVNGFSAVRCAKTAVPVDLPFGLQTWVGQRKHKFNRILQVVAVCSHGRAHGATWQKRLNRLSEVVMRPYVKLLWPLAVLYFCYHWHSSMLSWSLVTWIVSVTWHGVWYGSGSWLFARCRQCSPYLVYLSQHLPVSLVPPAELLWVSRLLDMSGMSLRAPFCCQNCPFTCGLLDPHVIRSSLGPPESTPWTAFRSVQPLMQSS